MTKKWTILSPERAQVYGFFLTIIAIGTSLLLLPFSWNGQTRLSFIDALFTCVSAVCVTGLASVDTGTFSRFGQWVILFLIQIGGLGVVSFTTLYLTMPNKKRSLTRVFLIRQFSIETVEYRELTIVATIIGFTFLIELVAGGLLFISFSREFPSGEAFFYSLFHSISAFCNAGFSPFTTSLSAYADDPFFLSVIMGLIVLGGIGFVVLWDIVLRLRRKVKHLSFHTKLVLTTTLFLIFAGSISFLVFEWNGVLRGMSLCDKVTNSFFLSISPRTAGFNSTDTAALSNQSIFVTLLLMWIGGAPGSIAGGIKVTTFAVILIAMTRGLDYRDEIGFWNRRIPGETVIRANIYAGRALFFIVLALFGLMVIEPFSVKELLFETVSALGTVGLSLGITSSLTSAGKGILIATMFAGRVGLIAAAISIYNKKINRAVLFPKGEVLIG